MKDKEKQIEEMAKEIFNTCAWRFGNPNDYKEIFNDIAEDLTKLNYIKITEDIVVLSREEYDSLKAENDKYVKDCINYLATINKLENKVWEVEQQASKETAEKLLNDLWHSKLETTITIQHHSSKEDMENVGKAIISTIRNKIQELAKQHGIEIKE